MSMIVSVRVLMVANVRVAVVVIVSVLVADPVHKVVTVKTRVVVNSH